MLRRNIIKNQYNSIEQNRFETSSEFKESLICGGEVEFHWNVTNYTVSSYFGKIGISEFNRQDTEKLCETPDEVLEYMVGNDRLRDVITQVAVLERTL